MFSFFFLFFFFANACDSKWNILIHFFFPPYIKINMLPSFAPLWNYHHELTVSSFARLSKILEKSTWKKNTNITVQGFPMIIMTCPCRSRDIEFFPREIRIFARISFNYRYGSSKCTIKSVDRRYNESIFPSFFHPSMNNVSSASKKYLVAKESPPLTRRSF